MRTITHRMHYSREAANTELRTLQAITTSHARPLILDITGVPLIVAQAFVRAAQATKLLGTQTIIVGVSPEVAQMLVSLAGEISTLNYASTLADIIHARTRSRA